ncbi:MAG: HAMP domain-containing histidine kinase [Oscillatoria sp. SIO1A7]|nr:HAMP domain-containing histidine kinase [Oscillatoria sp. SIO1A7]
MRLTGELLERSQASTITAKKADKKRSHWLFFKEIRYQIALGYAIAIGTAVAGTAAGILIGNAYYTQSQQKAIALEDTAKRLIQIDISRLKAERLFLEKTTNSSKSSEFNRQLEELRRQLGELRAAPVERELLEIKNLETKFQALGSSEKIEKQLAELGATVEGLTRQAYAQEEKARSAVEKARALQAQLIAGSLVLSVAIAILWTIYGTKAIARPIKDMTKIAKEVAKSGNFALQVPVATNGKKIKEADELAVLAYCLNKLILKARQVLKQVKTEQDSRAFQSEKMVNLGKMVAGVAHELNNPLTCIYGNLEPIQTYTEDLLALVKTYQAEIPKPPEAIREKAEAIELNFIAEDLPQLVQAMKVAGEQARDIALALKNFSRIDNAKPQLLNLHDSLDSTLLILQNRIKKGCKVVRNYGTLPPIEGHPGLLSQVFINLIGNALDALEEKPLEEGHKKVTITTNQLDEEAVEVRIADNGSGISEQDRQKMFNTFFTTKPQGVGTGLGLAISRKIVVEKHRGTISCYSEPEEGTEFAIALPISQGSMPSIGGDRQAGSDS